MWKKCWEATNACHQTRAASCHLHDDPQMMAWYGTVIGGTINFKDDRDGPTGSGTNLAAPAQAGPSHKCECSEPPVGMSEVEGEAVASSMGADEFFCADPQVELTTMKGKLDEQRKCSAWRSQ